MGGTYKRDIRLLQTAAVVAAVGSIHLDLRNFTIVRFYSGMILEFIVMKTLTSCILQPDRKIHYESKADTPLPANTKWKTCGPAVG